MKKIMQEKHQVIPDSDLSPEFLSQFKREADVSKTITHKLQNSNLNSQFTPNFSSLKHLDTISRGTYILA